MSSKKQPTTRAAQVDEIIRCGRDPAYFINNYVKIQHPKRGLIPFQTYDFQDECVEKFERHRFNIVLKSRQLGLSTVTAAYAVWYAIFKKDKNILIIATKLSTAINFIKKVQVALDNLPKWLLLTSYDSTRQSVRFSNGSVITAIPTSPDAGRSEALSLLIVDEAAFIREFEDIWTGLYPTLSEGGSAIILSTPHGVGGQYYKLWISASSELDNDLDDAKFNAIKLPWYVHPEHDQEWFDKETKNLSKKKVAQEYLCDFISSGDTFLQPSELDYIRDTVEQPKRKEGPVNGVWVWIDPEPHKRYVISADVARGDAADFSTFHVIDYETCEVCAEYMGKIPPDKFADLLAEYGKRYNEALISPERNTFGYFTCVKLRDDGYKRLYYPDVLGDIFSYVSNDPNKVPGFETQQKTRQQILAKLEELIRNKVLKTRSQRLCDQLQAFIWNGQRAQASRDSHDDLVMSVAIGAWLTNYDISGKDGTSLEHTYAMLKSSSVARTDISNITGDIMSVAPPPAFGTMTSQKKISETRRDINDFSWLLR